MKCYDDCEIYMIMDAFGKSVTSKTLLANLYVGIKNKEIEVLRVQCGLEIQDHLK